MLRESLRDLSAHSEALVYFTACKKCCPSGVRIGCSEDVAINELTLSFGKSLEASVYLTLQPENGYPSSLSNRRTDDIHLLTSVLSHLLNPGGHDC